MSYAIRKAVRADIRANETGYLETIRDEAQACCSNGTMDGDEQAILEATVCSPLEETHGGPLFRFVGAMARKRTWRRFESWCVRNRRQSGVGEDEDKTWLQIFLEWLQDGGLQAILEFVMAIISMFSMSGMATMILAVVIVLSMLAPASAYQIQLSDNGEVEIVESCQCQVTGECTCGTNCQCGNLVESPAYAGTAAKASASTRTVIVPTRSPMSADPYGSHGSSYGSAGSYGSHGSFMHRSYGAAYGSAGHGWRLGDRWRARRAARYHRWSTRGYGSHGGYGSAGG